MPHLSAQEGHAQRETPSTIVGGVIQTGHRTASALLAAQLGSEEVPSVARMAGFTSSPLLAMTTPQILLGEPSVTLSPDLGPSGSPSRTA